MTPEQTNAELARQLLEERAKLRFIGDELVSIYNGSCVMGWHEVEDDFETLVRKVKGLVPDLEDLLNEDEDDAFEKDDDECPSE